MAELQYHVISGYAGIRIYPERNYYEVIEPYLSAEEKKEAELLKTAVLELTRLHPHHFGSTPDAIRSLSATADGIMHEVLPQADGEKRKVYKYYLLRDFSGAGMLEPILRDENIDAVYCTGAGIPVEVAHRDFGTLKTSVTFKDVETLEFHSKRTARKQGLKAKPHAGGGFSIEKQKKEDQSLGELVNSRTLSKEILAHAWLAAEDKTPIVITGGDENARNAVLNAVSTLIPPFRRIISIEHTREVAIPHRNWTAQVTRMGYGPRDKDGKRLMEKTFDEVLKESLEKKPDHLILRECEAGQLTKCGKGLIAAAGRLSLADISRLPPCMLITIAGTGNGARIREILMVDGKATKICEWDGANGAYEFHEDIHEHTGSEKERFDNKMRALNWIGERAYYPPFFGIFSEES